MIKILAIGNSFSEDATWYLHELGSIYDLDLDVYNLYIGGCNFETHYNNIKNDAKLYQVQQNGTYTSQYVSIDEMLRKEKWDIIFTQQASHDSGWRPTFDPFLELIVEKIKSVCPTAKICLMKTWSYDTDSTHSAFVRYHFDADEMYLKLSQNYKEFSNLLQIPLISCGDVVEKCRSSILFTRCMGVDSMTRDGFHMHKTYGRYALSLTILKTLFHIDVFSKEALIQNEEFNAVSVSKEKIQLIKQIVDEI